MPATPGAFSAVAVTNSAVAVTNASRGCGCNHLRKPLVEIELLGLLHGFGASILNVGS
jgi:hypothetical protein